MFKAQIHYDNGSQHTLANNDIGPLILSKKQSKYAIELATITGFSTCTRQIATIKIDNTREIEAILVKDLNIDNFNMPIPKDWLKYQPEWSHQITPENEISAQILLGSDQAILHPLDALDDFGLPIESENARLKKSVLMNKYIAHGHNTPKITLNNKAKKA